jgi:hypothetical protein
VRILGAFATYSIVGAQGVFAYPNDTSTAAIKSDPVARCFDFGRKRARELST